MPGPTLTKWTHACVVLDVDGRRIVIDPGIWSEDDALAGADAVLLTHAHNDHVDLDRVAPLAARGVPVWAPLGASLGDLPFTSLVPGQSVDVVGVEVVTVGGEHARVVPEQDVVPNLGYLVADAVYHPGDSLALPGRPVDTLLAPLQGSWLKTTEVIEFLRTVVPRRALGVHDAQINDRGRTSISWWLERNGACEYQALEPGETLR